MRGRIAPTTMPERDDITPQDGFTTCFRAAVVPDSFDEKALTVEVTWGTRGGVLPRPRWFLQSFPQAFDEKLSFEPDHVDLARLNNGGPVLNSHGRMTHRSGPSLDYNRNLLMQRALTSGVELALWIDDPPSTSPC